MNDLNQPTPWLTALVAGGLVFFLCGLELSARQAWAVNAYLANKVLACTAFVLLTLAVTVGALRAFGLLRDRRPLLGRAFGLVGFGFAVVHVLLTLVVESPEQPGTRRFAFPAYYLAEWPAILCSIAAFVLFSDLVRRSVGRRGNPSSHRPPKFLRQAGLSGVALIGAHVLLLKVPGWITWVSTFEPLLPPLSLLVTVFVLGLIGVKIAQVRRRQPRHADGS